MEAFGIFGLLFSLLPVVATVLVLVWIYHIKISNETQVTQNKQIIQLLEDLKKNNE